MQQERKIKFCSKLPHITLLKYTPHVGQYVYGCGLWMLDMVLEHLPCLYTFFTGVKIYILYNSSM